MLAVDEVLFTCLPHHGLGRVAFSACIQTFSRHSHSGRQISHDAKLALLQAKARQQPGSESLWEIVVAEAPTIVLGEPLSKLKRCSGMESDANCSAVSSSA